MCSDIPPTLPVPLGTVLTVHENETSSKCKEISSNAINNDQRIISSDDSMTINNSFLTLTKFLCINRKFYLECRYVAGIKSPKIFMVFYIFELIYFMKFYTSFFTCLANYVIWRFTQEIKFLCKS